ncbi:MAG TPA: 50S ribosomal protein L10 [Firmicutes bacterium]|nr:50S ribosomal protein L10 [Bacillota bacterium]
MGISRNEKQVLVQELVEQLGQAKGAVLTDYKGINVNKLTDLRRQLRKEGVEFKVVKNTLAKRAANELGIEELNPYLEGPTAIAFSLEDPVAPAKAISNFIKANKVLEIKAGLVEGKVISLAGVQALADLPSREMLIAQVVGAMAAPLSGFVNVLQGPIRKLGYALEAIRKQKEA